MNALRLPLIALTALLLAVSAPGCGTARKSYYNAWEKFGYAKRERLVDNVKEARQEQVEAKQQFTSALEQFRSVVNFQGGDLERVYNKLNREYQRSETQANAVREKVTGVKRVAGALFTEWQGEIARSRATPPFRAEPELLDQTRSNYDELITRMDAAAASMDPVLRSSRTACCSSSTTSTPRRSRRSGHGGRLGERHRPPHPRDGGEHRRGRPVHPRLEPQRS
jgi:hypothetical protein